MPHWAALSLVLCRRCLRWMRRTSQAWVAPTGQSPQGTLRAQSRSLRPPLRLRALQRHLAMALLQLPPSRLLLRCKLLLAPCKFWDHKQASRHSICVRTKAVRQDLYGHM